jgi:hypothetical protein
MGIALPTPSLPATPPTRVTLPVDRNDGIEEVPVADPIKIAVRDLPSRSTYPPTA